MEEVDFNIEFENFYCPATGQQVLQPYDNSPLLHWISFISMSFSVFNICGLIDDETDVFNTIKIKL